MSQVILSATVERSGSLTPKLVESEVDEVIRKLEGQLGGTTEEEGTEFGTPRQQLLAFSNRFFEFMNENAIDSASHTFIIEGNRFTAILMVEPEDGEKIAEWFLSIVDEKG